MTTGLPALTPPGERRTLDLGIPLAVFGVGLALLLGLAVGMPTLASRTLVLAGAGVTTLVCALLWPFAAFRVMLFSVILLAVYVVINDRGVNPIDAMIGPVLIVSIAGGVRARAKREDDELTAPAALEIRAATRRLTRTAILYYAVAVLSLVVTALRGHPQWALDSGLLLVRVAQGLAFFPIALWWLRKDHQIRAGVDALQFGVWALLAVNIYYMATLHVTRGGMAWLLNVPDWPISGPNEMAISVLVVWALFRARITGSRPLIRSMLMVACLFLLVASQSRSGLLAWGLFTVLTTRLARLRNVAVFVLIAVAAAVAVPPQYWERMTRTMSLGGGSFEAYSSLIRVYSWRTALKVFGDHPILGVGYACYRFVSWRYNELGLALGTAEQYFIETAAGMGVIGLVTLGMVLTSVWNLGAVIRRNTPPGSAGHEMARLHGPLFLAMIIPNLTGDGFCGMTTLAQISVWCALLVRFGQRSVVDSAIPAESPEPR